MRRPESRNIYRFRLSAIPCLVTCLLLPAAAALDHGRISYARTDGLIRGPQDDAWSYATVNTLVVPGDTVWVDSGGQLEVELPEGTWLRLADGSKLKLHEVQPQMRADLVTGSFYVQRDGQSQHRFSADTPACSAAVHAGSLVRFDVSPDGATTLSVFDGRADVRASGGATTIVRQGKRVYVDPGFAPSELVAFGRDQQDDFDSWSHARAQAVGYGDDIKRYVAGDYPLGLTELQHEGRWVNIDEGYGWRPPVDYTPYRHGFWSYVPACQSYVWVDDHPFGYVTTHYGRWRHHADYGWVWVYRTGWAPAWVAGVRTQSHYIWSPLDIHDQPVRVRTGIRVGGGLRFSVEATTYCSATRLPYGPCPVYPLTQTTVVHLDAPVVNVWTTAARSDRHPEIASGVLGAGRDYRPRRVIRGRDTVSESMPRAYMRAGSLERHYANTSRSPRLATPGRETRTPIDATMRQATARQVRLSTPEAQTVLRVSSVAASSQTEATQVRRARAVTAPERSQVFSTRSPYRTDRTPARQEDSPTTTRRYQASVPRRETHVRSDLTRSAQSSALPTPATHDTRSVRAQASTPSAPRTQSRPSRTRSYSVTSTPSAPSSPPSPPVLRRESSVPAARPDRSHTVPQASAPSSRSRTTAPAPLSNPAGRSTARQQRQSASPDALRSSPAPTNRSVRSGAGPSSRRSSGRR